MSKIKICKIIENLLYNQNHGKWIDYVRTFCEHSGGSRNLMIHNGYPEKFIELYSKNKPKPDPSYEVSRKPIYLNLAFKGDQPLNDARYKIKSALRRTYPSAQLRLIPSTRGINLDKGQCSQLENSSLSRYLSVHLQLRWHLHRQNGPAANAKNVRAYPQVVEEVNVARFNKTSNSVAEIPAHSIAKNFLATGHTVDPNFIIPTSVT